MTSWRDKSAKVQVKESELPSSIPAQTGLTFNIWYNKWSQGFAGNTRFVSPFALQPQLHSGKTRGDNDGQLFFCLFFAKGMCCLGPKCEYLHHIPDEEDIGKLALRTEALDCFGREKFADYREDMGGIGSFRKKNKTLYVGGIDGALNSKHLKPAQIESRIRFVFSRLGDIDRIRYVESKNCGFVKFKYQANAEFAKEAMSNQTLLLPSDKEWDDRREGTGLLVKWANEDPDPAAQKRLQEELKLESLNMMVHLINNNTNSAGTEVNNMNNERLDRTFPEASVDNVKKRLLPLDNGMESDDFIEKLKKVKKNISRENISSKPSVGKLGGPLLDYLSSDED
ncbi:ADI_G0007810.mRNA.1.CDS.1 [Saccharomyces cerevisiae]|uniref:Pre-mRNA-splicing factor CWC2 n=1 Tax=Saccharomyces cerevisiae (strain AWRI1631) TaxID=545124 RepID=B5VF67_YEAS6|nr:Cwc2p [Saccharomyces cerevisiae YJM993]AJU57661.1 Cwc2p [Saccharomyces cerevisiae YJM189]AJU74517.1 Cwc2p [Saccharomyces cerevisiae YJM969]AJU75223.1 Cwc2p [Saccharomyces cerevisiae YJM972]AJU75931.1 Cwc2p [Saccharomyces cerevisiae YJM975]AJU76639.1 Cwc2p [Saccharomyces cerevisiae YJM978]AJU77351.1 Cwc2p [Saccharomyces cerevisiae YJM981]AJU78061.1 Cwc2p [Saccharomyces cerevisiae YJM984]AJU78773.1 Cwc2p [Saccharomyces cerevisiae YJM987]AJU79484.1 Cwc2p [Saccharomyces cerevisiae YJM990]A